MPKLKFYDLRKKKSFTTDKFKVKNKRVKGKMRKFAVAKAPSGTESWRALPKDFKK